MSRIYWDTMLFAYWLEGNPDYAPRVRQIFEKMEERCDVLCTSAFSLGEILVAPLKQGTAEIARQIRDFFRPPHLELLPFTPETAERYAQIRATHRVSPADAIHLATAAQARVDLFLTNDRALAGRVIPGIQFIAGMDVNLF